MEDFSQEMSGTDFEKLVLQLILKMGFDAQTTKASGDGGIDIIAFSNQPFLKGKYIIQCKKWVSSVGEPILRDLYGVVMSERANKGILVTTSYFTQSAVGFAYDKPIELIDGKSLNALLRQYGLSENLEDTDAALSINEVLSNSEEYLLLSDVLRDDPENVTARLKILANINDDMLCAGIEEGKFQLLVNESKKHVDYFLKQRGKSKEILAPKYTSMLYNAQICVLQGDLLNALKYYVGANTAVMSDGYVYPGDSPFSLDVKVTIYTLADVHIFRMFNILQIFNILGLFNQASALLQEYGSAFAHFIKVASGVYQPPDRGCHRILGVEIVGADETETNNRIAAALENPTTPSLFIFGSEIDGHIPDYDKEKLLRVKALNKRTFGITANEQGKVLGVDGFPPWSASVLENMDDMSKKAELLY
jgi:hypothetical protein